jgi:hypothetical protein
MQSIWIMFAKTQLEFNQAKLDFLQKSFGQECPCSFLILH